VKCLCGFELGENTPETHGLCPACGRSRWMQAARLVLADGEANAAALTAAKAELCPHGGSVCFTRCAVELVGSVVHYDDRGKARTSGGAWFAIPEELRQAWFDRQLNWKERNQ